MNILVTNDDGIESPGIWALAEAMSRLGDTMMVAPDRQQSGVGACVSLHGSMNIEEAPSRISGVKAYAVGGTPSDCVILALRRLGQGRRFDLLVSGINSGANMGLDVLYSGTVMATLQGYFRGIPSMAVSLAINDRTEAPCYDVAAAVAGQLALGIKTGSIPADAILNANIPDLPADEIKGTMVTKTAPGGYVSLKAVQQNQGVGYARGVRLPDSAKRPEGTDIWAINAGMISVTPLKPDITDHDSLTRLSKAILGMNPGLPGKGFTPGIQS